MWVRANLPIGRDIGKNIHVLKTKLKEIIEERRKGDSKSILDSPDLLSILVTDDLFKDDLEGIMDECITFFFAGS